MDEPEDFLSVLGVDRTSSSSIVSSCSRSWSSGNTDFVVSSSPPLDVDSDSPNWKGDGSKEEFPSSVPRPLTGGVDVDKRELPLREIGETLELGDAFGIVVLVAGIGM